MNKKTVETTLHSHSFTTLDSEWLAIQKQAEKDDITAAKWVRRIVRKELGL